MKSFATILGWIIFLGIIAGFIYLFNILEFSFPKFQAFPSMSGLQVLFFGLCLAFTWVEVLKLGRKKPFNCMKCMCGWLTMIVALLFHVEFWYLYLFAGLFTGAMFSAIKMRHL